MLEEGALRKVAVSGGLTTSPYVSGLVLGLEGGVAYVHDLGKLHMQLIYANMPSGLVLPEQCCHDIYKDVACLCSLLMTAWKGPRIHGCTETEVPQLQLLGSFERNSHLRHWYRWLHSRV